MSEGFTPQSVAAILRRRKSLNVQEGNARTRNVAVEGVESVETVEATGKS
jgi:hypothetical protein